MNKPLPRADINLAALRHNLQQVRRCAPHSRVVAMIKADGYGHGLIACGKALDGADMLGVARADEAFALRDAGITSPILLLGSDLNAPLLQECAARQIEVVVQTSSAVERLLTTPLSQPIGVWLKLDSGMHRLGFDQQTLQQSYQRLHQAPQIAHLRLITHFSSADNLSSTATQAQYQQFVAVSEALHAERSLANSAAIIGHPHTHAEWVRPGIMLYGDNPLQATHPLDLKPVMTLRSSVIAVREIPAGAAVGYSETWRAERDSRIATIAIGYGDGYPRHAANGTPVLVDGVRCPLAGRVSMDLISVDVTDYPAIHEGAPVVLWGEGLPAAEVAKSADTISYQLFTSVTPRIPRCYLDS